MLLGMQRKQTTLDGTQSRQLKQTESEIAIFVVIFFTQVTVLAVPFFFL